jgi:hypothetical protein
MKRWPVRRHRDQVAPLARGRGEDLVGGVAAAEQRLGLEPVGDERGAHLLQVGAVAPHLLALLQRELRRLRAAQPSATCMHTSDAPHRRASGRTWARIAASYGECSSGTRMRV